MNESKEAYIDQQISFILKRRIGNILILGAAIFLLLGIMDFWVAPDHFAPFLVYRLAIAVALTVLYALNTIKTSKPYQYTLILIGTTLSAVTIELMILKLGGHASNYYAGMNLLIICVIVLLPFSLVISVVGAGIIYAVYLVPIFIFDTITEGRIFVANNSFIISTFAIALTWRFLSQRSMLNELSLQYDLEKEKRTLQIYSTKLEDLVAEKAQELTISEQRYRALFDNANDGIAVLDAQGIMVNVNQRFCELHGFEWNALLGEHYRLLEVEERPGEIEDRLDKILGGESIVYEAEHFTRGGGRIYLEVSAKAIELGGVLHIQAFHRDITEKKRMQEELLQSQKMESIGVLAGGIAHDFNNILTAILGHAEVLRRLSGPSDDAAQRRIKTIEDAARRAGQMVSKLLSFARKESLEMVPMNLNEVVQDTLDLLERTLVNKDIKSRVELDPSLPALQGDSIQLEQVITNLIVNAADAMQGGGTITVKTSVAELGREASMIHPLLRSGRYVVISVADEGAGIPPEIMDRIFEPFFTTKGPGKGTGLGLAMVYGIVKAHRGEIRVRSEKGKGATFEIYLPATESQIAEMEPLTSTEITGKENVLVVDDEKDVLSFIKDTLESHGYKVLVSDNPVYAQDLFHQIAAGIDLVITDMVMPLVNGRELVRQFRRIRPDVKIIAMSGLEPGIHAGEGKEVQAFLKKPFEGLYLLSAVRRVLDSASVSAPDSSGPLSGQAS